MIRSHYLVYDCETGGLNPTRNPITQYACLVIDYKTLKELDRFETFVRPYNGLLVEREAVEKTMVRMSDIRNGIEGSDLVNVIREFNELYQARGRSREAGRLVAVGHNIVFDNGFLEYLFTLYGQKYYDQVMEGCVDTMLLGKMMWGVKGDEKMTLTACTERARVRLKDAHGAMNDVEATADLFRYFCRKMRARTGTAADAEEEARASGREFFEFRCGVKRGDGVTGGE